MSLRSVRRLLTFAGVISATVLAFAGSALPVEAVTFATNGSFGSVVNHDGQCLEIPNGSTTQGVQAVQNPCNGLPRQQWSFILHGTSEFLVQNERSNLCLSILNKFTGVGGRVVQEPCSTSNNFELWTFGDQATDGVEIANVGDGGLVMHPALCTTATNAEIYMNKSDQCAVDAWHGGQANPPHRWTNTSPPAEISITSVRPANNPTPLLAWWKLDEGSGTAAHDATAGTKVGRSQSIVQGVRI